VGDCYADEVGEEEDDDDDNAVSIGENEEDEEDEGLEDARSEVRYFLDQFNIYFNRTSGFGGDSLANNATNQQQMENDSLFNDDSSNNSEYKQKGKGKGKRGGPAVASSCPVRDKKKSKK